MSVRPGYSFLYLSMKSAPGWYLYQPGQSQWLAVEWQPEVGGLHGLRQGFADVEVADEEVAGGYGHVHSPGRLPSGPVSLVVSFTPCPVCPSAGDDGYSSGAAVPMLMLKPPLPRGPVASLSAVGVEVAPLVVLPSVLPVN